MKVLFALAGLHRFDRGAEIALMAVGDRLAKMGDEITLIGSGRDARPASYRYRQAGAIGRETFEGLPPIPALRNETAWEDATFAASLLRRYSPRDYDVTVTCAYPFTNWALRRPGLGARRPAHVFVTQNGDWPAYSDDAEYRLFGCDGLVCINPDYYDRNRQRWRCALIPNGVDVARFRPGVEERAALGLPAEGAVILMVSALIDSKRVADGIRAVSLVPGAHLVVAGDGPLRDAMDALARELLPGRFTRLTVAADRMPALYRSADVFLHLSREESFGNVYIEALATGLPVVGHDTTRLRWIVGGEEPLLDTTDPADVAAALAGALRSTPEAQERRVKQAERFDWGSIAAQYRAFFEEVIAARQPAR